MGNRQSEKGCRMQVRSICMWFSVHQLSVSSTQSESSQWLSPSPNAGMRSGVSRIEAQRCYLTAPNIRSIHTANRSLVDLWIALLLVMTGLLPQEYTVLLQCSHCQAKRIFLLDSKQASSTLQPPPQGNTIGRMMTSWGV